MIREIIHINFILVTLLQELHLISFSIKQRLP